jgi:hypothetical protein
MRLTSPKALLRHLDWSLDEGPRLIIAILKIYNIIFVEDSQG